MKYETTIHFEVKDEKVDLTDLIAEQKIDIHGVDLVAPHRRRRSRVGNTDDVGWRRGWRDDKKVKMAQATKEISRRLGVDDDTAEQLCEGTSYVYELMATQGLCAYPGDQPAHAIPEALDLMRTRAPVPEEGN
jgi:hypothetical protein